MNKVIFLDIDGVLLPGRAYYAAYQTKPLVTIFDPCVVGMLNHIAEKKDYKFVLHSNWRRTEPRRIERGLGTLKEYFVEQGILPEYLHEDFMCPMKLSSTRWDDILFWLDAHPDVVDYWIIEDEKCPDLGRWADGRVIQTDFDEGLTVAQMFQILNSPEIVI